MGGEIIEFSTQTTETTAVPVPRSSTPTLLLPLSRMTLCQPDVTIPSADVSVDRDQQPQPCSSYSPEPIHGTPKLKFPPRLSLHKTKQVKAKIASMGMIELEHPPYSPDLAPCDFYLFPKLPFWSSFRHKCRTGFGDFPVYKPYIS